MFCEGERYPQDVVSFVDYTSAYTFDHHGTTVSIHDIEVTVPPGAIPEGIIVHIEMGVALYGPFSFPENRQPVSPILWFSIKEDVELLLPITYKVPHVIADIGSVNLMFVKAKHTSRHRNHFTFEEIPDAEISTSEPGYGSIISEHRCFLCIAAGKTKNLALKKKYSLHVITKRKDSEILLACTYFLKTCFEVILYSEPPTYSSTSGT